MADDQEARVGQRRPQLQNIQRRDLSGGFPMTMFFLVRTLTTDEGRGTKEGWIAAGQPGSLAARPPTSADGRFRGAWSVERRE